MKKSGKFVFGAILGIAFFVSLGSVRAFAVSDEDMNPKDDVSPLDVAGYDSKIHQYEIAPSRWAIGIRAAADGIPLGSSAGNSFQVYADWILPFQRAGLFSLGGHLGSFPLVNRNLTQTPVTYDMTSVMAGAQFRYQLRFMRNQALVPTAALEADYYQFKLGGLDPVDNANGLTFGVSLGLMFNLGWVDTATASDSYETLGMTRAYLTFEVHQVSISNPNISLSGTLWYLGLRLEFE